MHISLSKQRVVIFEIRVRSNIIFRQNVDGCNAKECTGGLGRVHSLPITHFGKKLNLGNDRASHRRIC